MEGECTEQDAALAVKWFQLAADQGLAGSLTTLAMMYQEGRGVERNEEEAKRLYVITSYSIHYTKLYDDGSTVRAYVPGRSAHNLLHVEAGELVA